MMKLDLIDRKILYNLDQNARQSLAVLAKKLRIGRNVVLYRLNRLKENKIVHGSYVEINTLAVGYHSFRVLLRLSNFSEQQEELLIRFLSNQDKLTWLSRVNGNWDLDFVYTTRHIQDFDMFWQELSSSYNQIIESSNIALQTSMHRYPKDYLLEIERKSIVPEMVHGGSALDIDEKDLQLLVLLTKDATLNVVDIARILKLSINTVKKRMQELEKRKVILGYRLLISADEIGYEYYKLHINFRNYSSKDVSQIRGWLEGKNFMIYTDKYINGDDLEIELHLPSEREYLQFIVELKGKFGQIIKNISVMRFYDVMIFRYLPLRD